MNDEIKMVNETKTWICDNCGGEIMDIKDGWLEWLSTKGDSGNYDNTFGMRIVHRVRCIYDEWKPFKELGALTMDMDLEHFAGPDGLVRLLALISRGEFKDMEEVLEIIKRIHIPGHEAARLFYDEAISEDVFDSNIRTGYYTQRNIEDVLNYIKER